MYNLGDQFKFDLEKAKSNPKSIIQGHKYRITILTDNLVRLEYSKLGHFSDLPTENVWFRSFTVPEFSLKEDDMFLEVIAKKFKFSYTKNKPFKGNKFNPMSNFKLEILNTDKVWYYNHPEVRNFNTIGKSFEDKNIKGLYSQDGFVSINDSSSKRFEETGTVIDAIEDYSDIYVFIYNEEFNNCLKDYYELTGKPAFIPRYALGNWWNKNVDYKDLGIKKLVDEFNFYDIPLSILLMNSDWHKNNLDSKKVSSGFSWNLDNYKNPQAMVKYLNSNGIRLGLTINPEEGFFPFEDLYEKAISYLKINNGDTIPFNVLDPKVLDVYLKLFVHPLENQGVDFFYLETNKLSEEEDLLLSHYHYYDMKRNYKRRPMLLNKNSLIAPHRYPIVYSGKTEVNWKTLKKVPEYNLLAAHSGISFVSHDIGGFHKGIEDNELYIRFVQLGVFSPILKFGSDSGKYYKREPWRWNIKTYTIVQDYLKMRHRLIPYLYTESYEYYKNGKQLIEPIYFKYKDLYDDENYKYQYFFGSSLYISPIINKKEHIMNRVIHKFFIPEGTWYDFVTGKKFPGGKNYVSFFKDQDYPVFAKSGAIIPFGENDNLNDTTPPKNMEFHIFPGKDNIYKLYEDDGVSELYLKGYYLLTNIEYNYLPSNYTVIVRAVEGKSGIIPETRNYKFRFRNTKKADEVIAYFNNIEVPTNSYVDGTDFVVEVDNVKTIGQLTINCKGKDIEIDAVRIINEDIETIISDLQIETELKEKIDNVLFSELPINKKRIEIRKLKKHGLDRKFVKLFLKLLEYIKQV